MCSLAPSPTSVGHVAPLHGPCSVLPDPWPLQPGPCSLTLSMAPAAWPLLGRGTPQTMDKARLEVSASTRACQVAIARGWRGPLIPPEHEGRSGWSAFARHSSN